MGFSNDHFERGSAGSNARDDATSGLVAVAVRFANVAGRDRGDGASPVALSDYINAQFDPALSWDDLKWLRSIWDGPIVLRGVPSTGECVVHGCASRLGAGQSAL